MDDPTPTGVTETYSIYEVDVDPEGTNNAHASAIRMVGWNRRILEVGCAGGHVTRAFAARRCSVVGIELDADAARGAGHHADRVVVGDVEDGATWEELAGDTFDAIVFGDVLEHVKDPAGVVRRATALLRPAGFVVASVPNVAHADVRLALLDGRFRYRSVGLLDSTHLRFFTYETLLELLAECGLSPVELERIVMPVFGTEIGVSREEFERPLIERILTDPEAETYQFVVKAVVDHGDEAVRKALLRLRSLEDMDDRFEIREAVLRSELDELTRSLRRRDEELAAARADAEEARAGAPPVSPMQATRLDDCRQQLDDCRQQLEAARGELEVARGELEVARGELEAARCELEAARRQRGEVGAELDRLRSTRTFRWTAPVRGLYGRVRRQR